MSSTRHAFVAPVVASVLVLTAVQPAGAGPPTVCKCADVFDLINRLSMDEAAIAFLKAEIPKIEAHDKATKRTSRVDDKNDDGVTHKDLLKAAIRKVRVGVQMQGGSLAEGDTPGDCKPRVTVSGTACMNEVVMWHEEKVHEPACTAAGGKKKLLGRPAATTVDYIKEEIAGYEAEVKRILEILRSMPTPCRPSGWIGYIEYFEESSMESRKTLPPVGDRISGSEEAATSLKRGARILYRETGSPRINVYVKEIVTKREAVTGRISCIGGAATPKYTGTASATAIETNDLDGIHEGDVAASFTYDPQTGDVSVGFTIPGFVARGTHTKTDESHGNCNAKDDGTKTSSDSFPHEYLAIPILASGKAPANANVVRGEEILDLGPPVTMPDAVIQRAAKVSWVLFKVE